jgi:hypothetical protein
MADPRSKNVFNATGRGSTLTQPRFILDTAANASASPVKNCSSPTRLSRRSRWRKLRIRRTMAGSRVTFGAKKGLESMRIDGVWHLCDDGAVRPVLVGEVETRSGEWTEVRFQVDTGADRTVLSSNTFACSVCRHSKTSI